MKLLNPTRAVDALIGNEEKMGKKNERKETGSGPLTQLPGAF